MNLMMRRAGRHDDDASVNGQQRALMTTKMYVIVCFINIVPHQGWQLALI